MPIYNVEQYIERALLSALNQTYQNLEILIVDDLGHDNSMDIVYQLKHTHPRGNCIRIITHKKNLGLGGTRNTAIESAQGKYPEEAVMVMNKIALKTESTLDYASLHRKAVRTATDDASEAICMSVAEIASKFNVAAIVAFTDSGFTARKMSRYRTKSMIIAATPNEQTTRALAINWGVKSVLCKQMDTRAAMIEYAQVIAKENLVEPGEQIIVTAGTPGVAGTTSYLELITVK